MKLSAFMRVWGMSEDIARGMIAIEKLEAKRPRLSDDEAGLSASSRLAHDLGAS